MSRRAERAAELVVTAEPVATTEPAAFANFYRDHFADAARLAFLLTGSPDAAQDLTQDVFVRLHRHWPRITEPRAYLRRSVVNACHSYHRRRFLERRRDGAEAGSTVQLGADELSDALARLPYRQRAALVLRFYRDFPDEEIGTVLGCRRSTVRSLVHRGLQELRKVIEP